LKVKMTSKPQPVAARASIKVEPVARYTVKCADCGQDFPAQSKNAQRCKPCRDKRANDVRRRPKNEPRDCAFCGSTFRPVKSDAQYCSPECAYQGQLKGKRAPETAKDPQMQRLFHDYTAKESITITDRPEGTRLLALSDTQFPFVDEPLLEAVYTFVQDWKPNDIILNGDIVDMYEVSDFDKRPERAFSVQTELEMARDLMVSLKRYAAKDSNIWWIDGNHEERFNRYLWRKAAEIQFAVADLPALLHLDELAAGYVPYGKHVDYLGFVFTHGNFVSQFSAYTAKRHLDRYRSSGANGHTHRLGSYSVTDMHGRSHTWYEMGSLCRRDLDYVKGVANWQSGFLLGTVAGGALHTQLIHVIETSEGRGFFAAGRYYAINDVR
jgi:hypothetical protein